MSGWRFQRGEITPGCIIGIIVLIVAAVIAIKTIPVMTRVYEFTDEAVRVADAANSPSLRNKPKAMAERLAGKARDLQLPVTPEMIKVTLSEKYVQIQCEFDVEIDYGVYQYTWHRKIDESRPLF